MVQIIVDNYIRVTGLPAQLYSIVTSRLTYPNPKFIEAQRYSNSRKVKYIPRVIHSYEEHKNELLLPRGYYFEFLTLLHNHDVECTIVDNRNTNVIANLTQQGTARSYQEQMLYEADLYPGPSFMMQAPPGSGKTFCGMEYARRAGRKTLWVCHTGPLLKQAIESASWILGIPEAEIGIIGEQKFRIGDFITIALVQSLRSQKRIAELSKLKYEFGTVIVDEVHHSPARTWNQSIHMFAPEETIGLTATAYRTDGLTEIMFDCVGPVVTRANPDLLRAEGVLIVPSVYQMYTNFRYQGINYNSLLSTIAKDQRRTEVIRDLIDYIYQKPESVTMILSHRKNHVEAIQELCNATGLPTLKLIGTGVTKTEKALAYEKLHSHTYRIIVATYKLLSEGFDYPPINHMILATPFKDEIQLEQVVGRSQRMHKGKSTSVIVDLVDNNRVFMKQANTRKLLAQGLGMEVKSFNATALKDL